MSAGGQKEPCHVIIVMPDLDGRGYLEDKRFAPFIQSLKKLCVRENYTLVPLVNGHYDPRTVNDQAKNQSNLLKVHPILSKQKGVVSVLREGYEEVLANYQSNYVVRMDTAEHPLPGIAQLIALGEQGNDLAMLDLRHSRNQLGVSDVQAHNDLFEWCMAYFDRKIYVGLAHSFHCYRWHFLQWAYPIACHIIDDLKVQPVEWGFEFCLLCIAYLGDKRIATASIEADSNRFRPYKKVFHQLKTLKMILQGTYRYFDRQPPAEAFRLLGNGWELN